MKLCKQCGSEPVSHFDLVDFNRKVRSIEIRCPICIRGKKITCAGTNGDSTDRFDFISFSVEVLEKYWNDIAFDAEIMSAFTTQDQEQAK